METNLRHHKTVGVNRKPGRGDLCPKAGCIHKLAKWNLLGVQGQRLLAVLDWPVRFTRLVIGNCESESFSVEDIACRLAVSQDQRTVVEGMQWSELFDLTHQPSVEFASEFRPAEFVRENTKRPAGSSIVAWTDSGKLTLQS